MPATAFKMSNPVTAGRPTVTAKVREGRRTPHGYKIFFIVTTSDGWEFRSYKSHDEAEQAARAHCAQ